MSQGGISMRGRRDDDGDRPGRVVYTVTLRGLEPGATVTLRARGRFELDWACGVEPEPCGEVGCGPLHIEPARGTVKVTTKASAGQDGIARARIRLVAPAPAKSCPAGPAADWYNWLGHHWDRVQITDASRGLILTPPLVDEFDTI